MSGSTVSPKVSVILSTYNGERYLVEALDSVLSQDFRDLEFVVVDDGSSDRTVAVLEEVARRDPRLKVLRNPANRGVGYSYSFLLDRVRGQYVAAIGQDDRWEPGFLSACVEVLDREADVSVVFSEVKIIDSDGKDKPPGEAPFHTHLIAEHPRESLMIFLIKHNFLCAGAAVFRSKDIAGWHTLGDNDQLQDWNTWQRLILKGRFHAIPQRLVSYRVHGNNLSLGGHSPTQVQVELLQTRLEMLGSREFAQFILESRDPSALFLTAMTAYSEILQPGNELQYHGLLHALRRNEDLLRNLESYRDVMAMLFLYTGSFQKARRYSLKAMSDMQCPPRFWQGFEWQYLFTVAPTDFALVASPFIKFKRMGPLICVKLLTRKGIGPRLGVRVDREARSLERWAERALSAKMH